MGSRNFSALLFRLRQSRLCEVDFIGFDKARARRATLREREGVRHCAADEHCVALVEERVDNRDFVGNFRAAQDYRERTDWVFRLRAEEFEFLFYEKTRDLNRQIRRYARDCCVRSVRRAESVVYIGFRARVFDKLLCKFGVVLLFFGVEARVFEENYVARFHFRADFLYLFADAVVHENDGLAELFGQRLRHGSERELRVGLAFRAAEVARENDHCAFVEKVLDCGQRRHNAGVVADIALRVKGHVEIDANENFLSLQVDVFEGLDICHSSYLLSFLEN